jgi:Fur family peroxide stress response transcriptional regulator
MQPIDDKLASFTEVCRQAGLKVTHQRLEIYRELVQSDEHPDAEDLFERTRRRIPSLSLDTLYRTLRMLEDKGIISRVGSIRDRARFDPNTLPHHHFVCSECGLIADFTSGTFDHLPIPPEVSRLGGVESVYVELRGRCRDCREKDGN